MLVDVKCLHPPPHAGMTLGKALHSFVPRLLFTELQEQFCSLKVFQSQERSQTIKKSVFESLLPR